MGKYKNRQRIVVSGNKIILEWLRPTFVLLGFFSKALRNGLDFHKIIFKKGMGIGI